MGVFDIVGPVMIGPSSSHTAGAARIGLMARNILRDEPVRADITLYGSFARTYRGHGTDKALIAGLLGLSADDVRLRHSFDLAHQAGLAFSFTRSDEVPDHPNTAKIEMVGKTGKKAEVVGVSLGGGRISIREITASSLKSAAKSTRSLRCTATSPASSPGRRRSWPKATSTSRP